MKVLKFTEAQVFVFFMNKTLILLCGITMMIGYSSCVSKKKFLESENSRASLIRQNQELREDINSLKNRLKLMEEANESASAQINEQQSKLLQWEKELTEQQEKIQMLQSILDKQKENTEALRKKLATALGNFDAEDLSVHIKNGKVYVSLSEKLLFESGSAEVNADGKAALKQVADALNDNPDIQIMVEGHTDTVPIKIKFPDNWALSVARATSIVRILTVDYGVDPKRVTASGRSQYEPVADNSTPEGRALNRRTEIILAPKLDELMNLISD